MESKKKASFVNKTVRSGGSILPWRPASLDVSVSQRRTFGTGMCVIAEVYQGWLVGGGGGHEGANADWGGKVCRVEKSHISISHQRDLIKVAGPS